jgi:hypothetical protein
MKDAFKTCMTHLYPDRPVQQHQLADLIRTFAMGYMEALISVPSPEKIREQLKLYEEITKEGWKPDSSWHWW